VTTRDQFRAGDVFRLMPFGDGRHGYGQILAPYGTSGGYFFFGVFATAHSGEDSAVERIVEDELALSLCRWTRCSSTDTGR
jgi:hypothetical protein